MVIPRPTPEKIAELNANPKPKHRYIHKKTKRKYWLLSIGLAENDGVTELAIYHNSEEEPCLGGSLWVRPLAEFAEKFELDLSQFDD